MSKPRHRRWWIVAVFVVIVAAAAAGGIYFFTRGKTATVHYLTATAATGTISHSVQADFTLASARGTTTISLGGSSSSSSSTSAGTSSSGAGSSSTGTSTTTGSAQPATAGTSFAALSSAPVAAHTTLVAMVRTVSVTAAGPSGSPEPTVSPTPSTTPTPMPTRTTRPSPTPSPRPSRTGAPSGGTTSGGGSSTGSGSSPSSSSTSSSTASGMSGVVTRISLPVGARPRTLERLLTVSGKPAFAFVSATPLYKDLSTSLSGGAQRVNVLALQAALKKRGYFKGSLSGDFTSATASAYEDWQADQGMSRTGVVDITRFAWVPKGSVVTAWNVSLGGNVSAGTALASVVSPNDLAAQALVSQADIASLKVGQKAQMTIDGYTSDTFTGTITYISSQPSSSTSAAGSSSSSTQYSITVRLHGTPKVARSGMTGTLKIIIAQRTNVLLVPTSAVSGTSTTTYVRVMMNGKQAYRQVQTGMATSSYTQITGGLTAGEVVVTGQYTNGATSTGTSGAGSLSNLRRSTGTGGFPAGGFPAGGGAFPGAAGGP